MMDFPHFQGACWKWITCQGEKKNTGKIFCQHMVTLQPQLNTVFQKPPFFKNGLNTLILTSFNHLKFSLHSAATSPPQRPHEMALSSLLLPSADMFLN